MGVVDGRVGMRFFAEWVEDLGGRICDVVEIAKEAR